MNHNEICRIYAIVEGDLGKGAIRFPINFVCYELWKKTCSDW